MAPGKNAQLEKVIDEVLKSGDAQPLDGFLSWDTYEATPISCSQQFLTKLDKLISRSLDQKDGKSASLGLTVLHKFGKNLKPTRGGQSLAGIIVQGLPRKISIHLKWHSVRAVSVTALRQMLIEPVIVHMVRWFEKCRQLWIEGGPQWDETLFNLSEDFFDALMVAHESCKEGAHQITELFLYPVAHLAVEPRIYILIQKEAIRRFNLILDRMPVYLKKSMKMPTSQEASDIQIKMAHQILDCGDHDFQTALIEALCRMATPDQRKQLANTWFSMGHVVSAFVKIQDSEFETDCRKFLNFVNGMRGDRRRVYSYPCLGVYLDQYELLMPVDEKLEEFWIDFNIGSHSISFYFSLADEEAQESQWETICITENEVQSYSITEECKRHVLQLNLSEVVVVGTVEGSSLTFYFSSSLDVLQAACSVFGQRKNKGFVGKTSASVVKTTVKILSEEKSSQVVPESQLSVSQSEKNTFPNPLSAPSASVQTATPGKMRISESSSVVIRRSAGGSERGASSLSGVKPSVKARGKPTLQMVYSCDKRGELYHDEQMTTAKTCSHGRTPNSTIAGGTTEKNKPEPNRLNMVLDGTREEESLEHGFVPDTQTRSWRNSFSTCSQKLSVSEMLMMPTQKISSLPRPEPPCSDLSQQEHCQSSAHKLSVSASVSHNQLHTALTQRLPQVLDERKQKRLPQEPFSLQRKKSNIRVDAKDLNLGCQSNTPMSCTSKGKGNAPAKRRSRRKMSLEMDDHLIKAPPKASASRVLQERNSPDVSAKANRDLLSKEKRDAELAGNMVKLISSRYENSAKELAPQSWNNCFVNRPVFNMSWLSTVKKDVSAPKSLMKFQSKTETGFSRQRKNPVTVNAGVPLSIEKKANAHTSVLSHSGIHDSPVLLSASKKGQAVAKEKRHVKKHLFSDTDTDYSTTEVSWLRESSRKCKPEVTKYSRQAPIKPKAVSPHTSYETLELHTSSKKPVKPSAKSSKNPSAKLEGEPDRPNAAARRPKRAAATTKKSYKELDTDSSLSESEKPPVSKVKKSHEIVQATKKKATSKQPTKSSMKLESSHQISKSVSEHQHSSKNCFVNQRGTKEKMCPEVPAVKQRKSTISELSANTCRKLDSSDMSHLKNPSRLKKPDSIVPELSKLNQGNVSAAKEQMNMLKDPWARCQTSPSPSPPFIERMRSAERSDPTLGLTCSPLPTPRGSPLSASPEPPHQDTPSPILLLSNPRSTVSRKENFKPSSFFLAEKKHSSSKTRPVQSSPSLPSPTPKGQIPVRTDTAEMSPVQQPQTSPLLSPQSILPLLTSTLRKPFMLLSTQSPFPEGSAKHSCLYDFSQVSSVSQVSLSLSSIQSSVRSSSVKDAAALARKKEKSPALNAAAQTAESLMSGPSRKRHISRSSTSEKEEKKAEKKRSKMREPHFPQMKPRQLFTSFTEVSADSEVTRVMSSSHVGSSQWELELDADMDINEDSESSEIAANPSKLCQQFSSEMKKTFENRHKMMEVYNKQSLKTMKQHVSTLYMELAKSRNQGLEKVLGVLQDEIRKLEHNDTVLKDMEKDLTMCWRKQSVTFHTYQEQENRRYDTLKKALQSNMCHSLEYEERLFTSQMCVIRKDMKSVQDRLLTQMQEGEIQSVKRGLHALFFS